MRDNIYLGQRLVKIWSTYFSDIKPTNLVHIRFGSKVRKRLGSIRKCNINPIIGHFDTLILINGHFRDQFIPEYVIDATIAHELAHYAHGFSSPLPQLSDYPHRGGLVYRELASRGLTDLMQSENQWLQSNWLSYLAKIDLSKNKKS